MLRVSVKRSPQSSFFAAFPRALSGNNREALAMVSHIAAPSNYWINQSPPKRPNATFTIESIDPGTTASCKVEYGIVNNRPVTRLIFRYLDKRIEFYVPAIGGSDEFCTLETALHVDFIGPPMVKD